MSRKSALTGLAPPTSTAGCRHITDFFKPGPDDAPSMPSLGNLPFSESALCKTLIKVFKLKEFRDSQLDIVKATLAKRDVFVLMATGGGKSLTFQLPAVMDAGITLVVSPLLSLIQNQINALKALGINAAALNSTLKESEKKAIYAELAMLKPRFKLLYITPELMATDHFRSTLQRLYKKSALSRLVVDEAHCISEWGHEFRKNYRQLHFFKDTFPNLPVMALTASATDEVQQDIIEQLHLRKDAFKVRSSFNRPNLSYEVRCKPTSNDPFDDILALLEQLYTWREKRLKADNNDERSHAICGIIYCATRATCTFLAERLAEKGIHAKAYHGADQKLDGIVDIVCATISFGMGIDRPDVRFVIHHDMPKSLEGYYQESGRAGRDGQISRCILYYSRDDRDRALFLLQSGKSEKYGDAEKGDENAAGGSKGLESFNQMTNYCENVTQCRHAFIVKYFGEQVPTDTAAKANLCAKCCDVCKDPTKVKAAFKKAYPNPIEGGRFTHWRNLDDGVIRLIDGTLARKRPNPDDDGGAGYGGYNNGKQRRTTDHAEEVQDWDSDDGVSPDPGGVPRLTPASASCKIAPGMSANTTMTGFVSAKSLKTQTTMDMLEVKKAIFGKAFITKYPIIEHPSHSAINITLNVRENTYEKILDGLKKAFPLTNDVHWNPIASTDQRLSIVESTAALIESRCYTSSTGLNNYKTSYVNKLQACLRLQQGILNNPNNEVVIQAFEEAKKRITDGSNTALI
ncbi:hypothetical protein SeMB42_g02472 [Synchytrium endobioticum]|uniref:ATP-dependent DNA helicase n=1 Tax=Synchytrium endobioticum TaxID=286115 RepID=A0A507DDQ8_9FUNG|nr:hypothetical protein SeMB42_g02472 [Synchytrium endobioticum]